MLGQLSKFVWFGLHFILFYPFIMLLINFTSPATHQSLSNKLFGPSYKKNVVIVFLKYWYLVDDTEDTTSV